MLRKCLLLFLLPLLAACNDTDFSIEIDKPKDLVVAELKKFDPNSLTATAGIQPTKTAFAADGSVKYILPKWQGKDGTVVFTVVETGEKQTTIDVAVDVPFVTRKGSDGTQYLDEKAMENALRDAMREWEMAFEDDMPTADMRANVSDILSLFSIGLQNFSQFERLAEKALSQKQQDIIAANAWGESGDESTGGWANEPTAETEPEPEPESEYGVAEDYSEDEKEEDVGGWGVETP